MRRQMVIAILSSLLAGVVVYGPAARAYRSDEAPSHEVAQRKDEGRDSPLDHLNTLLRDIESVDRAERIQRWKEIYELAETQGSGVAFHLREMAGKADRDVGRYQRFIAAANVAKFGNPTRFGPNNIGLGMLLDDYIDIQRRMVSESHPKPVIRVHPDIQQLKVVIPPNEDNDLCFQEILWRILEKYDLDFRTEPNGTFLIIPGGPKA